MVVRERRVYVGEIQLELLGDLRYRCAALHHPGVDAVNGDAAAFDVGLLVNLRRIAGDDPVSLGRHLERELAGFVYKPPAEGPARERETVRYSGRRNARSTVELPATVLPWFPLPLTHQFEFV